MSGMIQVTKRSDDYHAASATDSRIWGCGRSPAEAIGDLILSHQDYFDLHVSGANQEDKP